MPPKVEFLEFLQSGGVIVGDGSFVFTLERRGYTIAGAWTPEVVVQHPEAVKQLSREYARAGASVIQAMTYAASASQLANCPLSKDVDCGNLNEMAIQIAQEVAESCDAYVCGGITPTVSFADGKSEDVVREEFKTEIDIFVRKRADFLLGEFFGDVKEAVIAVECMKLYGGGLPVAITLTSGPTGDFNDVPLDQCAVMLKKAGADVIGLNCSFDPTTVLKCIAMMKQGLDREGLSTILMTQPCGFHCQEAENYKKGYNDLPEFPYALEPRALTRFDCYKYARQAYEIGVRYIGGCCGFEPHHIRALAMELAPELGRQPPGIEHADKWGEKAMSKGYSGRTNVGEDYWSSIIPAVGRNDAKKFATLGSSSGLS